MAVEYDALNLRVDGLPNFAALHSYLKMAYRQPHLQGRLIPVNPPYIKEEVWDLAEDRYLGYWLDDRFDFAGAEDAVVLTLDALFRAHLPLTPDSGKLLRAKFRAD